MTPAPEPREGSGGAPAAPTATAPLLYWLLLVCGLAGLTLQRSDAPRELAFLWIGTVGGAALGQLLARLRVRAWVLGAIGAAGGWLSPIFFFMLWGAIRGPAETCVYAFVPAALCGYLSFSARFGLAAFWYPAVLWMLVILDGPIPGAIDARGALPLGVGLAALFVAFLRASETRRVALWQAQASERLAAPRPRAVLHASPLRAASQVVWTGLVGATALVLTAWVAPQLWQREQDKHNNVLAAQAAQRAAAERPKAPAGATGLPCCPENERREESRDRVREYLPLRRGQAEDERSLATSPPPAACTACRDGEPLDSASGNASSAWSYGAYASGSHGSSEPPPVDLSTTPATSSNGWDSFSATRTPSSAPAPAPFAPTTAPPYVPPAETTPPWAHAPPAPTLPSAPNSKSATVDPVSAPTAPTLPSAPPNSKSATVDPVSAPTTLAAKAAKPSGGAAQPAVVVFVPTAAAPPFSGGAPWRSALAACLSALALHVLVRAARRQLTLRHLARPFWNETLDQRISNHWQRVLIGLRDAGVHATRDEQPQALARRVGIEGLATCATILERVRHGVRVDATDLEVMHAAASDVYRAARGKAGFAGRAAAWLRWPLA